MRRFALIVIASLCATGPVLANDSGWAPDATAEGGLREIARCVVRSHRDMALAVLATSRGSMEEQTRVVAAIDKSGCVQGNFLTFRAGKEVVRSALAEQLYLRSFTVAPSIAPQPASSVPGDGPVTLAELATCVVARDPQAADALLRTTRRSPEESAIGKRMSPAFNGCARGTRFDLNGAQIHGILAEALFKMRSSAAPGAN